MERSQKKSFYSLLAAIIFFIAISILPNQDSSPALSAETETQTVTRVIDGDTIELSNGDIIRYIGIDTPETKGEEECWGLEAYEANNALVFGKKVELQRDRGDLDQYGRKLRYVYVDDIFVNQHLISEGFGYAKAYPPNTAFKTEFTIAQQDAEFEQKGLWSGCKDTCNIKGNITDSGEKIYHIPGQPFYKSTIVDEEAGEQYFCTEEAAIEAGWRKAQE